MRRALALLSAVASAVAIVAVACSSDDPASPTPDAGHEAGSIASDAGPDADAASPGDVCGSTAGYQTDAPWPLAGGCGTRAGYSAAAGPSAGVVGSTLALPAGASTPAVDRNGVVWVGTAAGDVVALVDGAIAAVLHTGAEVQSSPAIDANGRTVVAGGDGVLYGVTMPAITDAGTDAGDAGDAGPPSAAIAFALTLGPMRSSPAIGPDGTVYVGTVDGHLVAVRGDGSATRWSVATNDTLGASPAIAQDGTIWIGSTDHALYAVSPDGTTKARIDLGAEIHGSPAVGGDGAVYVGTIDGKLHAIVEGKEAWSYPTGGAITGAPAVFAGTVYVGSADRALHAVATADGKERWTYATSGAVATPLVTPTGIYAGSADGNVYAISAKGTLLFAIRARGHVTSGPALGRGPSLHVTTDTGIVTISP